MTPPDRLTLYAYGERWTAAPPGLENYATPARESAEFVRVDLALTPQEAHALLYGSRLKVGSAPEGMVWHDYYLLWHRAYDKLRRIAALSATDTEKAGE